MKKINYNIVFIRFLAILIVMFGHSIIIYDPNWGLLTTNVTSNTLVFIKHIINSIQMPIWFTMAGFLYYFSLKKNKNLLLVFKDKFKKLLLPFLIIGLLYLIPIRYLVGYSNYVNHSLIYNIIHNLILGFDNGHLWYLPTLFIIFLIFNFYKNTNRYLDIVIFILLIYLNIISNHFPTYIHHVFFYL
ncbi:MAG: acyltransferase, partial [Bacilli bacterium]|nr:acyltransferase [Bacilli bacterium]